jgi:hypothetical protein
MRRLFVLGTVLPLLAATPLLPAMGPTQAMAQDDARKPPKPPKPKPGPVTQDAALAAITAAGYTNVVDLKAYGRTWHAMAVPPAGGAAVAVSVDPKGRVHADDGPAD